MPPHKENSKQTKNSNPQRGRVQAGVRREAAALHCRWCCSSGKADAVPRSLCRGLPSSNCPLPEPPTSGAPFTSGRPWPPSLCRCLLHLDTSALQLPRVVRDYCCLLSIPRAHLSPLVPAESSPLPLCPAQHTPTGTSSSGNHPETHGLSSLPSCVLTLTPLCQTVSLWVSHSPAPEVEERGGGRGLGLGEGRSRARWAGGRQDVELCLAEGAPWRQTSVCLAGGSMAGPAATW